MKRWHVVTPDAQAARRVYDDLVAAGVPQSQIHVFAKDRAALVAAGLPEPTDMEQSMVTGEGIGSLFAGLMGNAPADAKAADFGPDLEAGRALIVFAFAKSEANQMADLIRRHPDARSPEAGVGSPTTSASATPS